MEVAFRKYVIAVLSNLASALQVVNLAEVKRLVRPPPEPGIVRCSDIPCAKNMLPKCLPGYRQISSVICYVNETSTVYTFKCNAVTPMGSFRF